MTTHAGPRAVLLHAFGASGSTFHPVVARLPRPESAWAPDLPGFGGAADLPTPSVAAYADWVEAGLKDAEPGSVRLVGWSMGGKLALALAARRPAWLERLVLIAPSPPAPEPMDEEERRRQLEGWGDARLAHETVDALTSPDTPNALRAAAAADRLRTSPSAWRWWLEAGSREALDVSRVEAPAAVIVGGDDPGLGEVVQRRLTLPPLGEKATLNVLPGRHFLPIEAPDLLADSLAESRG